MIVTRLVCVVVVLVGLLLAGCARRAQPAMTQEAVAPPAEEAYTMLYDVRDLIAYRVPNYVLEDDKHGWPRFDESPTTTPTRDALVTGLTQLIMDVIDPASWTATGGGVGSIDEQAGQLVVNQTPANHRQIERLLKQLRETRQTQVTIQAFVMRGGALWDRVRGAAAAQIPGMTNDVLLLSAEDVQKLVAGRKPEPGGWTFLTAPLLTLFNGQRAFVVVATETEYVTGYARAEGDQGARPQFEPVKDLVHSGVTLDCHATVSSDRTFVTLNLHPRLSTLRELKPAPWPDAPAGRDDLQIQVPHLTTAGVDMTVSVPDRGWVVMRATPKHTPAGAAANDDEPVVLAFGATIIPPPKQ